MGKRSIWSYLPARQIVWGIYEKTTKGIQIDLPPNFALFQFVNFFTCSYRKDTRPLALAIVHTNEQICNDYDNNDDGGNRMEKKTRITTTHNNNVKNIARYFFFLFTRSSFITLNNGHGLCVGGSGNPSQVTNIHTQTHSIRSHFHKAHNLYIFRNVCSSVLGPFAKLVLLLLLRNRRRLYMCGVNKSLSFAFGPTRANGADENEQRAADV